MSLPFPAPEGEYVLMEWPKRRRNSHTWGEDKPSDQPTQAKRKSPKWKTLPSRPVQRPWESHDPWKDFHTHLCAIGHPLGRGKERVCSDNPAAKTFFGKGRKNRFRIILHCSVFSLSIKIKISLCMSWNIGQSWSCRSSSYPYSTRKHFKGSWHHQIRLDQTTMCPFRSILTMVEVLAWFFPELSSNSFHLPSVSARWLRASFTSAQGDPPEAVWQCLSTNDLLCHRGFKNFIL